jgi:hypothetical protein
MPECANDIIINIAVTKPAVRCCKTGQQQNNTGAHKFRDGYL